MRYFTLTLLAALVLGGCQSAYYNTLERFGVHKRDILVDRVEDARDAQEDAKEQFEDALTQFRALVKVDGGELEATYDRLNREYQNSVKRADEVHERIDAVENVAEALFREWEAELREYESDRLRAQSERQLDATRQRYQELIARMRQAEQRIDPVLQSFQDQVLVLKHNLNARAIAALQDEVGTVETDIRELIEEMEASIAEANRFLAAFERQ